ncbi:general secretion pathway protein [Achromobacter aloeverae]|uniref:General secretion pathway protein n=1 Tax=Achromobacter aloeverae TaxID=1750518 RepID=A0A4V1MSW8_9BURK|nr:general secretion pathway protein [Achromobacter aloeverae]
MVDRCRAGWQRACLRHDAARFAAHRADYYEYLADLLDGLQGRKTLRDIFDDDARRHGPATARGRLARHWALAYERSAGDVAQAWAGTLPAGELALLRVAQDAGGGAFAATLRDLARAVTLIDRARGILVANCAVGLAALGVALLLGGAVPLWTVPRLQAVFQSVPPAWHGGLTRALFSGADGLRVGLPLSCLACVLGLWGLSASLSRHTGRLRDWLDRRPVWRLYRDFHCIRFLALLSVLVRQRGNVDTRLREALFMLGRDATPWFAAHIAAMIGRIDAGLVGGDTFDTGLIDADMSWYLADMVAAHGVEGGVARTRQRIEIRFLPRLRVQAAILRWCLLACGLAAVLGLTLWHYAVIDEMRHALTRMHGG